MAAVGAEAVHGDHPVIDGLTDLVEATNALAALLEAAGPYYYEEIEVKRWVLGGGGKSGENCEICEENAARGWIDMDDVFDSVFGDTDDAPAHPHCSCGVEFKTKRKRVYV